MIHGDFGPADWTSADAGSATPMLDPGYRNTACDRRERRAIHADGAATPPVAVAGGDRAPRLDARADPDSHLGLHCNKEALQ